MFNTFECVLFLLTVAWLEQHPLSTPFRYDCSTVCKVHFEPYISYVFMDDNHDSF